MDDDDITLDVDESIDKSLVPAYLREWGLCEQTINNFVDNEITLEYINKIEDTELKELIPKIKERILFKVGLRKLSTITHDTASEETDSAPPSPFSTSSTSSIADVKQFYASAPDTDFTNEEPIKKRILLQHMLLPPENLIVDSITFN